MIAAFACAILLGAALLFAVQPMAAKGVLPLLGGSPAVWNTAMLFFQTALLAGYAYAHGLSRLRLRTQVIVHPAVLLAGVAVVFLANNIMTQPGPDAWPVGWLLAWLCLTVGPTFFGLASAGPLLQGWFSRTNHRAAKDPYFLYAASNAGSFTGLLAYPFLIEPALALSHQRTAWLAAYALFAVLVVICGLLALRRAKPDNIPEAALPLTEPPAPADTAPAQPRWPQRARWVLLAFVPSSLMLGVTTHLTTDVAAVPLLWVVPLSLYLLTFIAAFSPRLPLSTHWLARLSLIGLLALVVTLLLESKHPMSLIAGVHLAVLTLGGLLAHRRLADDRPPPARLTEFYLLIAVGGALGGVFNGLVAPSLFDHVLEYPITIALLGFVAAAAMPRKPDAQTRTTHKRTAVIWLGVAALAAYVLAAPQLVSLVGISQTWLLNAALVGVPALALAGLALRPSALLAGVLCVLLGQQLAPDDARVLFRERTFFGVHLVERTNRGYALNYDATAHRLLHGTTLHGLQLRSTEHAQTPTGYYHPEGPAGAVFKLLADAHPQGYRAALVGLGTGALAAYARTQDHVVFHEIDPAVVTLAQDPALFSYIHDARARGAGVAPVILGDGRLTITQHPERSLDLVLIDAFSSDAIPVHLLTLEAIDLYRSRLKPGGLLVLHISNQYLNLEPVVAAAGEARGLTTLVRDDLSMTLADLRVGRSGSTWALLVEDEAAAAPLRRGKPWIPAQTNPSVEAWTDERSDIWSVFRW